MTQLVAKISAWTLIMNETGLKKINFNRNGKKTCFDPISNFPGPSVLFGEIDSYNWQKWPFRLLKKQFLSLISIDHD